MLYLHVKYDPTGIRLNIIRDLLTLILDIRIKMTKKEKKRKKQKERERKMKLEGLMKSCLNGSSKYHHYPHKKKEFSRAIILSKRILLRLLASFSKQQEVHLWLRRKRKYKSFSLQAAGVVYKQVFSRRLIGIILDEQGQLGVDY